MSDAITVAIIGFIGIFVTSICTFLGVVVTNKNANAKMLHNFDTRQAVFEATVTEKIDNLHNELNSLNNEVKRYNNVKERTYNLETAQKVVETKVSSLEHKVEEMEKHR